MLMPYIEIKAKKNIFPGEAKKIIAKGTVIGVVTAGTISPKAKRLFDEAGIAWAEKIPEKEFMKPETKEES
jgi:glycine cleavage system aminomethyltransferase T